MKPRKVEAKAFLEFLELAEKYKPFQVAKRIVYRKYGLLGSRFDKVTTSIVYKMYRLQGILDYIIRSRAGVDPERLPSALRQYLRLAVYLAQFDEVKDVEFSEYLVGYMRRVALARFRPADAELIESVYRGLLRRPWTPSSRMERMMLELLLPPLLIEYLAELLPSSELKRFAEYVNTNRPLLGLRVNRLKASLEEVLEEVRAQGVEAWPSERVPFHIVYRGGLDYESLRALREGKAVPQDEASAAAAFLLGPRPGSRAADLTAAPGGKATHMAELMEARGLLVAFEIYHDRALHMRDLAARVGVMHMVHVVQADARLAPAILGRERFDYVLLDPPCTSTGAIAKHPEARWRLTREAVKKHVKLQRELLEAAYQILRPGGRLLYSVCSVIPDEGEHNITWFLESHSDMVLVPLRGPYDPSPLLPGAMRAWPHRHGTTGFFYALLEKKPRG